MASDKNDGEAKVHLSMPDDDGQEVEPSARYQVVKSPIQSKLTALEPTAALEVVSEQIQRSFISEGEKEDEKEKESKPEDPQPSYGELFRFADKLDVFLLVTGCLFSAASGMGLPMYALLFGEVIDAFVPVVDMDKIFGASMIFLGLGVALLICSYLQYTLFSISAERQSKALRMASLKAIMRQEIGWFDMHDPGTLATRIAGDTVLIREGISNKLGELVQFLTAFVAGFIIALIKGWSMALVMCAGVPFTAICMGLLMKTMGKISTRGQLAYAKAGAVAEETISSIRTVASFNGEKAAANKFANLVEEAEKVLIQAGRAQAIGVGFVMLTIFLTYALGMWFGGKLVSDGDSTPGEVFTVFFAVIMGSVFLGQASPSFTALANARGASATVLAIIRRQPLIDPLSSSGISPSLCGGRIDLKDVCFSYPSRPDVEILSGYNLSIEAGKTVALVGPSGGGKSTIISLIERFYDPTGGVVLLDGRDLREYNLQWLRSNIGLVSQEPILFNTSIAENIMHGREGATQEEVEEAARHANAHNFIMSFEQGYATNVGEKGIQISGGQKQRIAIARAILRDPAILLLDEATSALDNESERVVQEALDKLLAMKKRTTIVIAHRLSTIRDADLIAVISQGKVQEQGTHHALMEKEGGIYRNLVLMQEAPSSSPEEGLQLGARARMHSDTLVRGKGLESSIRPHELSVAEEGGKFEGDTAATSPAASLSLNKRVFQLNQPERKYLIVAWTSAILGGMTFPLSALLIAQILSVFNSALDRPDYLYDQVSKYALLYVALGLFAFTTMYGMIYCFVLMGEKLTKRLRELTFRAIVRQDIQWFDREENSTGVLTTRLATDATLVRAVAGENQARMIQTASTLISALIIAFGWGSWQLTLVLLSLLPLLMIGVGIQAKTFRKSTTKSQDELGEAGKLATEAISYIRTVASFGLEKRLLSLYEAALVSPMKEGFIRANIGGISVGFSQLVMFGGYALVFWYGGKLVSEKTITFDEMMRSLMAIMMAAQGMGRSTAFMGDSAAANAALAKIFEVEDRLPFIDSASDEGEKTSEVKGNIQLKDISFFYPTRPEALILRDFSLSISAGETCALVGSSGSGKSTVVSLLERYYDPQRGSVFLDGVNLKKLNVQWLRSNIGLVGQEPILFQGTIAENIAFGKPGASQEEVLQAARMANAHDFIRNFPDGFDTLVGDKGLQLSGGQKQRIAIARAIIKDPAILLLDEATSALDSESERVVQQALDDLLKMKRRTTVVIAHRLSTIVNADKIAFVHQGAVAEIGRHQELMHKNGLYAKLYRERNEVEKRSS